MPEWTISGYPTWSVLCMSLFTPPKPSKWGVINMRGCLIAQLIGSASDGICFRSLDNQCAFSSNAKMCSRTIKERAIDPITTLFSDRYITSLAVMSSLSLAACSRSLLVGLKVTVRDAIFTSSESYPPTIVSSILQKPHFHRPSPFALHHHSR